MTSVGPVPHVGVWVLERCSDPKFPYRLRVYRGERPEPVLSFLVRDRWPGASQHIFCLREQRVTTPVEIGAQVERVPVVALQRNGKRLTVILDRPRQKRCDFQIVEKSYKNPEPGEATTYEQIFWFTQTAMQQRRPRGVRLYSAPTPAGARVRMATDERYPWSFGGLATERGPLPAGDYALLDGDEIVAVVERKTLQGLLADFAKMDVLRQRMLELMAFEHHAVVIEARYEDLLSPSKVQPWPAAFCGKAIAELYALYPRLRLVFCSNRKTAAEWTRAYFAAVWSVRGHVEQLGDSRPDVGVDPHPVAAGEHDQIGGAPVGP